MSLNDEWGDDRPFCEDCFEAADNECYDGGMDPIGVVYRANRDYCTHNIEAET